MAVIAMGIFVEVLLVIRLGVVEGVVGRRFDFGCDGIETSGSQYRLIGLAGLLGKIALFWRCPVDGTAILRSDVIALLIPLRRVVIFPKGLEELIGLELRGVVCD